MKLHKGIMKNQELAEWFGIKEKTFTNSRKKKLEELKNFADFNEIRGGVDIKDIYEDEYIKDCDKKKKFIEEHFMGEWENENKELINTGANVAAQMLEKYPEIDYKKGYLKKIVNDIRGDWFGIPNKTEGLKGNCRILWAKTVKTSPNTYVCCRLTEEEEELKNELLKKYFTVKSADEIEQKMIVKGLYEEGIICAEDTVEALFNLDNLTEESWRLFLMEFKAKTGGGLMRSTELLLRDGQEISEEEMKMGQRLQLEEKNKGW